MTRRWLQNGWQALADLALLAAAFALAVLLRYDFSASGALLHQIATTTPWVVAIEFAVLLSFGVHRFSWRYVGLREGGRIVAAVLVGYVLLMLVQLLGGAEAKALTPTHVPAGVLLTNLVLCVVAIAGVRVTRRSLAEQLASSRRARAAGPASRTLLVGAGEAGVLVARELRSRPDLALLPVGFVDDDPAKLGSVIQGIPVVGVTSDLPALCARHTASQVLVTMASAPGSTIRRIAELCESAEIPIKIIPGIYEIVVGKLSLLRIRDVAIEDLLRRAPVALDLEQLGAFVRGKAVLVTGAGGSIGSELCRQLCRFAPARLILAERAENALFRIHRELGARTNVNLVPSIADVTDAARMRELFEEHRPALVFHAAAHKHVPLVEWNPAEGVKNNVFGTKTVADLAAEFAVEAFVMISTDKAVNPTSVMGATKRAAELYVQSLTAGGKTRFVMVRFGNVLGSAGSVVPIFREQIAQGGPITITHPDMRRYFMTIPEASQLVLQAGAMGQGGEIFVLDMGEPVKIVDLARDLIALSGLEEGKDIAIEFTGTRPGEKLFEELSTDAEQAEKTRHPKIFVGRIEPRSRADVMHWLGQLDAGIQSSSERAVLQALHGMVPEFQTSGPEAGTTTGPTPAIGAATEDVAEFAGAAKAEA